MHNDSLLQYSLYRLSELRGLKMTATGGSFDFEYQDLKYFGSSYILEEAIICAATFFYTKLEARELIKNAKVVIE